MDENLDLSKNFEISQALKEFETKSQSEQMQKSPEVLKNSDVPKMTRLVMKWFKIDQRQTEYVLLGFVVVAIGVSIYLVFGGNSSQKNFIPYIPIK